MGTGAVMVGVVPGTSGATQTGIPPSLAPLPGSLASFLQHPPSPSLPALVPPFSSSLQISGSQHGVGSEEALQGALLGLQ